MLAWRSPSMGLHPSRKESSRKGLISFQDLLIAKRHGHQAHAISPGV
jgi:hypothetical protein